MRQPICSAQSALKYMTTIMVLLVPLAHGTAPATPNSKADQRSSLCSRPGYVFIPCKQPANGDQKITLLTISHTASANGSLQSVCDQTRSCAAYTTGGIYFTVSAETGRIGPLIDMSNCQPYKDITRVQDCQGIYVSDKHMVWQPLLTVTRNCRHWGTLNQQDTLLLRHPAGAVVCFLACLLLLLPLLLLLLLLLLPVEGMAGRLVQLPTPQPQQPTIPTPTVACLQPTMPMPTVACLQTPQAMPRVTVGAPLQQTLRQQQSTMASPMAP